MSSEIKVDTISENTSAGGVTIDSLAIKDGKVTNLMNSTLNAADMGAVHIKVASSGDTAIDSNNDDLVIENDNHAGITISTPNDKAGGLYFSDPDDAASGRIVHDHNANTMIFQAGNLEFFRTDSSRKLSTGGEDTPDCDPGGITLDHNANDNLILTAKSSDVAHGRTSYAETDTYFTIAKAQAAGGASITSSNGTSSAYSLFLNGHASGEDTTKSTSGIGPVIVTHRIASGTSFLSVGSNANMFVVQNASSTKFIVDAEGDIHYDGSASAYDSYNDAHLVRAFDQTMSPKAVIQSEFDKFVEYKKDDLVKAGLLGDVSQEKIDEGEKPLVCLTGMQRLHNGAIWQQYEKHQKLAEAVYEMAKEALGEDKADAILEKHDIKLLN